MQNLLKAFFFISLGGFLYGYSIGITSAVVAPGQLLCRAAVADEHVNLLQIHIKPVQRDLGSSTSASAKSVYTKCFNLSAWARGFLTASNLIGATISSLFCFRYADGLGRRREVQLAAALYFIGATVAAVSPHLWGIITGFLIYGFGLGIAMHVAPMFIAEIAPADIRGMLIACKELLVVSGMVVGFLTGCLFEGIELHGWRFMMSGSTIFAAIMGIGISLFPDSPRWLELQGRSDDALAAMQIYREGSSSKEEVEDELQEIHIEVTGATTASSCMDAFNYPRPMLISSGLFVFQQITGQPSVLYFSTTIFRALGFGNSAAMSSVGLAVVKLLATLFSASQIDTSGRRKMLLTGIGLMTVALIALTVSLRAQSCIMEPAGCPHKDSGVTHLWSIMIFVALMVYVSGYQIGFGPISWIIVSEVFPLHVKSAAISVTSIINFSCNIAVTTTIPVMLETLTPFGLFFVYTFFCIASIVFVWYILPETKGKKLEEISALLATPQKLA